METFTEPKELVENPKFQEQRQKSLASLNEQKLDAPIIDLVYGFNQLPYCFTLQSCYGHFIHDHQMDPCNLERLPDTDIIDNVEYRIAYIAFCIENSPLGRSFLETLRAITRIDPENIQFCCAEWFWKRQVNSYALQVEPERFKDKDRAVLNYREALHIEKRRDEFFVKLEQLLQRHRENLKSA